MVETDRGADLFSGVEGVSAEQVEDYEVPATAEEDRTAEAIESDRQGIRKRHHSGKHHHTQRTQQWSGRSKLLFTFLTISIVAIFFIVLFFSVWVYGLNRENGRLKMNLLESEHRLAEIGPENEKLRKDLETLLQGHLPGLKKIEFDKVINLNDAYVKNILFTQFNSKNEMGYEFKIVLNNSTLKTIWPDFLVLFFDSHGIQVHSMKIGAGKSNYDMRVEPLAPGEIRSHASAVGLTDNTEVPEFFMVRPNNRQGDGSSEED